MNVIELIQHGQAFVKTIRTPLNGNNEVWEYVGEQLKDPEHFRPAKTYQKLFDDPEEKVDRSLRYNVETKVWENRENATERGLAKPGATHTKKLAVSMPPADGNLAFYDPAPEESIVTGLVFDRSKVILTPYIFDHSVNSDSRWWLSRGDVERQAEKLHEAITIEQLIDVIAHTTERPMRLNEQLVKLCKEAISGVFCRDNTLVSRLAALSKMAFISNLLGLDELDIVIIDPEGGMKRYTHDQMRKDLFEASQQDLTPVKNFAEQYYRWQGDKALKPLKPIPKKTKTNKQGVRPLPFVVLQTVVAFTGLDPLLRAGFRYREGELPPGNAHAMQSLWHIAFGAELTRIYRFNRRRDCRYIHSGACRGEVIDFKTALSDRQCVKIIDRSGFVAEIRPFHTFFEKALYGHAHWYEPWIYNIFAITNPEFMVKKVNELIRSEGYFSTRIHQILSRQSHLLAPNSGHAIDKSQLLTIAPLCLRRSLVRQHVDSAIHELTLRSELRRWVAKGAGCDVYKEDVPVLDEYFNALALLAIMGDMNTLRQAAATMPEMVYQAISGISHFLVSKQRYTNRDYHYTKTFTQTLTAKQCHDALVRLISVGPGTPWGIVGDFVMREIPDLVRRAMPLVTSLDQLNRVFADAINANGRCQLSKSDRLRFVEKAGDFVTDAEDLATLKSCPFFTSSEKTDAALSARFGHKALPWTADTDGIELLEVSKWKSATHSVSTP